MMTNSLPEYFLEHHPANAARLLEKYEPSILADYLASVSSEAIANIFRHMNSSIAAECLVSMTEDKAAAILEQFSIERAALLLRRMSLVDRIRIIRKLSSLTSNMLRLVLRYPQGTVGQVMNPNVFAVSKDRFVSEVIALIQENNDQVRSKVYVLNDKHRLIGMVFIRDLLVCEPGKSIEEIMREPEATISARASLSSVKDYIQWNDRDNLPVVDQTGKFIGILKRGVMLDALKNDQNEMQQGEGLVDTAMTVAELFWEVCANVIAPQHEITNEGKDNERTDQLNRK